MKFIFKVLIIFFAVSFLVGAASDKYSEVFAGASSCGTYLVLGLDDASKNADVILAVSLSDRDSDISVIQIPRDTYCRFDDEDVKINSLFARYIAKGFSEKEALSATADYIGRNLGVGISGYVAVGTGAFTEIIDELGGVTVNIPDGFSLLLDSDYEYSLKSGENILSGKEALYFVRYRKGYERGDLERIDTQKIFLNGLLKTVTDGVGITNAISLLDDVFLGVSSSISFFEAMSLARGLSNADSSCMSIHTLPGEAVYYNGSVWYYVLNKLGVEDLLSKCAEVRVADFDTRRVFTKNDSQINDIYNKDK